MTITLSKIVFIQVSQFYYSIHFIFHLVIAETYTNHFTFLDLTSVNNDNKMCT